MGHPKDEVQHTSHITHRKGEDNHSPVVTRHYGAGDTGSKPFNHPEGRGVVREHDMTMAAGRYPDSPVPGHAETPNPEIKTKAGEVAAHSHPDAFPSDGVVGRG